MTVNIYRRRLSIIHASTYLAVSKDKIYNNMRVLELYHPFTIPDHKQQLEIFQRLKQVS